MILEGTASFSCTVILKHRELHWISSALLIRCGRRLRPRAALRRYDACASFYHELLLHSGVKLAKNGTRDVRSARLRVSQ